MSTKDRSPLTTRCDSSGSDDVVPDRNSPSPYSMLSNQMNGSTPYNHDYANPQDLKNDIAIEMERIDGSRKKRNLIYEPINTKGNEKANGKLDKNSNGYLPSPRRRNSGSDEILIAGSVKGTKRNRTLLCLVIAVFVLSLVAVSLAVIAFMSRGMSGTSPVGTNGKLVLFVCCFNHFLRNFMAQRVSLSTLLITFQFHLWSCFWKWVEMFSCIYTACLLYTSPSPRDS